MEFSRRKLPKEAAGTLRQIPVEQWEPFHLLLAPCYIFLPKNQKFVAVKGPLHFFSPDELEKFRAFENFYVPEFVDLVAPFQRVGKSIRELLNSPYKQDVKTTQGIEKVSLPGAQYELSDAVMRRVGSLWGAGVKVEPFFLCFFTNEICQTLPPEVLLRVMNDNADRFELALLRASTAVFLALQIGYIDLSLLRCFRDEVFHRSMNLQNHNSFEGELSQITRLVELLLPDLAVREISIAKMRDLLESYPTIHKVSKKIVSHLRRVEVEFIESNAPVPTLYGQKGIRNG